MRSLSLATLSLVTLCLVLSACNVAPAETPTPLPEPTAVPGAAQPTTAPTPTVIVPATPAPGQVALPKPDFSDRVDAFGYRLELKCWGTVTPTVILDSDLGLTMDIWGQVIPTIAAQNRVCAYNHAGLGSSDKSPIIPRTSLAMANDISRMMLAARIDPPFVLVSQGYTSLAARLFYRDHAADLAGLVFVSPSSPNVKQETVAILPAATATDSDALKAFRAPFDTTEWSTFPESLDWDTSIWQAARVPNLGATPLIILWDSAGAIDKAYEGLPADLATKLKQLNAKLKTETAQLSTKSEVRDATKAGRIVQDDAQFVTKAILDMLAQVKAK